MKLDHVLHKLCLPSKHNFYATTPYDEFSLIMRILSNLAHHKNNLVGLYEMPVNLAYEYNRVEIYCNMTMVGGICRCVFLTITLQNFHL